MPYPSTSTYSAPTLYPGLDEIGVEFPTFPSGSPVITTWVLLDAEGGVITEVTNAATKQFSAKRNIGRQGILTLTHQDIETAGLLAYLPFGAPKLLYYRNGVLRLAASLTSIEESVSDGQDTLTAIFKDPFGVLYGDGSETGRFLESPLVATGVDQGIIAWDIINSLNLVSDTDISLGAIEPTILRDRSYDVGKHAGQALMQLTEVDGGPDIEYLPLDPNLNAGKMAQLVVHRSQGTDLGSDLLWGYGPGTAANVLSANRRITPPINHVRLTGSTDIFSVATDANSLLLHGRWSLSGSAPNDISVQSTLDALARSYLRPHWRKTVDFAPDTGGPQPFEDYWLGDTGRFESDDVAFQEDFSPRINGISITEGSDGEESHTLELQEESTYFQADMRDWFRQLQAGD